MLTGILTFFSLSLSAQLDSGHFRYSVAVSANLPGTVVSSSGSLEPRGVLQYSGLAAVEFVHPIYEELQGVIGVEYSYSAVAGIQLHLPADQRLEQGIVSDFTTNYWSYVPFALALSYGVQYPVLNTQRGHLLATTSVDAYYHGSTRTEFGLRVIGNQGEARTLFIFSGRTPRFQVSPRIRFGVIWTGSGKLKPYGIGIAYYYSVFMKTEGSFVYDNLRTSSGDNGLFRISGDLISFSLYYSPN